MYIAYQVHIERAQSYRSSYSTIKKPIKTPNEYRIPTLWQKRVNFCNILRKTLLFSSMMHQRVYVVNFDKFFFMCVCVFYVWSFIYCVQRKLDCVQPKLPSEQQHILFKNRNMENAFTHWIYVHIQFDLVHDKRRTLHSFGSLSIWE